MYSVAINFTYLQFHRYQFRKLSLQKKLINISNIRNEITNIIEKNPKYKILIKSHKKIAVQKVIRLIEEVRLAGTDNIKLINLEK